VKKRLERLVFKLGWKTGLCFGIFCILLSAGIGFVLFVGGLAYVIDGLQMDPIPGFKVALGAFGTFVAVAGSGIAFTVSIFITAIATVSGRIIQETARDAKRLGTKPRLW
jgi:hypothetical protein